MEPIASTADSYFSSKSLGIRAQKKILGKMSSRNFAKHFIDDRTAYLLDDVFRLLKDYYNKKESEKVVKCVIKMTIKVGVLLRNDQFSPEDMKQLSQFQRKLHTLIMTVISFCQVEFSYDRNFLKKLLQETQTALMLLIRHHLSDKSHQRIQFIFAHFARDDFLDAVFKLNSRYSQLREQITGSLSTLIDDGHL